MFVGMFDKCRQEYLNLKQKYWEDGENYILRSFRICTFHHISIGL
jgi:hypothetical protein